MLKTNYIDGKFISSLNKKAVRRTVFSPANLDDKVFEYFEDPSQVVLAGRAAYSAQQKWAKLKQKQRESYLWKLARVFEKNQSSIAKLISKETGKPLWESLKEAEGLSKKIEITLKSSMPLVRDQKKPHINPNIESQIRYRPKGVCAVLGPFNLPMYLPTGWIIPALASGNTIIFKPSEYTPACGAKLAECMHKSGFPKGVFNLLQGRKKMGQAVVKNPLVSAVFFTGSYAVGRKIQEMLLNHPEKLLALEMGGKNSALIWHSANIKKAVQETLKSAFLSSGQRCSATSRIILHPKIKKAFLKEFIGLTRRLKIGQPNQNVFMGPLISQSAVHRFLKAGREALREKAFVHLKGGEIKNLNGYYVSPFIVEPKQFNSKSYYQNEELFAPFLTVYCTDNEETAIDLINRSGYGLSLSIFAKEKSFINKVWRETRTGVIHVNLSSNQASPYLPFGGYGRSGNDRSAGFFAVKNCVSSTAYRAGSAVDEPKNFIPGKFFNENKS